MFCLLGIINHVICNWKGLWAHESMSISKSTITATIKEAELLFYKGTVSLSDVKHLYITLFLIYMLLCKKLYTLSLKTSDTGAGFTLLQDYFKFLVMKNFRFLPLNNFWPMCFWYRFQIIRLYSSILYILYGHCAISLTFIVFTFIYAIYLLSLVKLRLPVLFHKLFWKA